MIYRGNGGLSFGLGVVVEMVVVFLGFLELGKDNNGGERERERERELPSFVQHPSPLFIEFFRVGEDSVRTERISDCYNP